MSFVPLLKRLVLSEFENVLFVLITMPVALSCRYNSCLNKLLQLSTMTLRSICPANCAGRGICDYTLSPAQCECFDRSDTSPFCSESPWEFAPTISPAPTISASPTASPTISRRPTESLEASSGSPACYYGYFQRGCVVLLLLVIWP